MFFANHTVLKKGVSIISPPPIGYFLCSSGGIHHKMLSLLFALRFRIMTRFSFQYLNTYYLLLKEVDPNTENEDTLSADGMDNFLSELANAVPGIDEAMSFAEMLK